MTPLGLGTTSQVEPVEQVVGRVPQSLAAAQLDRRDGDVHRVDQVGLQELANGCDAAADPHVLARRQPPCDGQRFGWRGIDEVERGVGEGEAAAERDG